MNNSKYYKRYWGKVGMYLLFYLYGFLMGFISFHK